MFPGKQLSIALLALLLCCGLRLNALDLPVSFAWDSANTTSYTPAQNRKELAWNEFYRISIGLDSLQCNNFKLNLKLQSYPDFIDNNLEIRDFRLSYQKTAWEIAAASILTGYGLPNQNHPNHIVSANQDDFLYQEMRFNGLEIAHKTKLQRYYLQLGGNVHNQATGILGGSWRSNDNAFAAGVKQEFRALDTHWRTPVSVSALFLNFNSDKVIMAGEAALSYFLEHERTQAHTGFFAQTEGKFIPNPQAYLYLSAYCHTLEPKEQLKQRYQLVWHQSVGKLALNPGVALDIVSGISDYQAFTSVDWFFAPDNRLGFFYRYQDSRNSLNKHTVGIQAAMRYGL
ncbi:MAG: hypothetical protein RBS43_08900 [Candidatus Cloacimonas sp.]|jgi:hypothetical protein|nr:hypothetical protein [Candidatus Cloacimonas sp.]